MSLPAPASQAAAAAGTAVPPTVPSHFQSFVAFDFGAKRTGVRRGQRACCAAANPQPTIRAEAGEARLVQAGERIKEWQPDALVIGVPYHPDGNAHENTARAKKFGRQLREPLRPAGVYEVDERYSTTEALAGGAKGMPTRPRPASSWNSF